MESKKDTNELIAGQKQTHRLSKQTYGYQRRQVGWGMAGTGDLKLAHAHCILNAWPMGTCSTTQRTLRNRYSVIIYMGKESEKEWMCVYV